jgi:hypothetical protein
MESIFFLQDKEVVDEVALMIECLSSNTGLAGFEILRFDFRDQFLKAAGKSRFAH